MKAIQNEQTLTNNIFEIYLRRDCLKYLDPRFCVESYVNAVLDEMWNGESYESVDGTAYYYEIPRFHTKHCNPVIVSL